MDLNIVNNMPVLPPALSLRGTNKSIRSRRNVVEREVRRNLFEDRGVTQRKVREDRVSFIKYDIVFQIRTINVKDS